MKNTFGLLGKNIDYSFSKKFFTEKFKKENLPHQYLNFDINHIDDLSLILNEHIKLLKGFNVTIPYKEEIHKYLDQIDDVAKEIGAINTVKIIDNSFLKGYNTDFYGFTESIKPLLKKHHKTALILGNGGATKAIKYSLKILNIPFIIVSRNPTDKTMITYNELNETHFKNSIIINCTPVGTYPNTEECPAIPYQFINEGNLLYDLVYNPLETQFLKNGKANGAQIKNGLEMLELQALKSWDIWCE